MIWVVVMCECMGVREIARAEHFERIKGDWGSRKGRGAFQRRQHRQLHMTAEFRHNIRRSNDSTRFIRNGGVSVPIVWNGLDSGRIVTNGGDNSRIVGTGGINSRIVESGGDNSRIVWNCGDISRFVRNSHHNSRIIGIWRRQLANLCRRLYYGNGLVSINLCCMIGIRYVKNDETSESCWMAWNCAV